MCVMVVTGVLKNKYAVSSEMWLIANDICKKRRLNCNDRLQGREPTSRSRANKYVVFQKKIISDHVPKKGKSCVLKLMSDFYFVKRN